MKSRKYCPRCRKVREVIEDMDEILCKHCGRISPKTKHSLHQMPTPVKVEKSFTKWFNKRII